MKVLTAAEMRACDEQTTKEFGVTMQTLMENAGAAVSRFALLQFPKAERITILCGKGNNGGDGMVAARYLAAAGKQVTTLLLAKPEELQGCARAAYDALETKPMEMTTAEEFSRAVAQTVWAETDLFIDAIFGTGFKPPLQGIALAVRDAIAESATPVLAVDLPSGWDADATDIAMAQLVFRADAVVTFTAPKLAHMFGALMGPAKRGALAVAEIGSPEAAVASTTGLHWTGAAKKIVEAPRNLNGNKGMFGHVLVIGGSRGKAGAPSMTAMAALRAGAGLVTAAVPSSLTPTVSRFAAELMTLPMIETILGGIAMENFETLKKEFFSDKKTILAMGTGLGRDSETAALVRRVVHETTVPLVLDADGLNAFAGKAELLNGHGRTLVLTPHPGEMARLLGTTIAEVEKNRVETARSFAVEHELTLVLKGWRTLVAHPDGSVGVNTSGNPGMSKGGSGDILTGIVAALIGQFPEQAAEAVEAAVWLHGCAADIAVEVDQDEHTLLATDTLAHLANAFRRPVCHDGFTWLQEGHA